MRKIRWPKPEDILLSIIIDLLVGVILLALPSVVPISVLQIPSFLGLLFINDLLILMAIWLFREKEEPIIKLSGDLKMCFEDFGKFFGHPYRAVMPNPFQKEPDFWKYYENTFSYVLYSWYSNLKVRFDKSRMGMDIDELVSYSNEFCEIVKLYLVYAESFREFVKKYPIPKHIREQYNTKFVSEFNTIFRPDLIKFLKNLQMQTDKEKITIDIGSAAALEVIDADQT